MICSEIQSQLSEYLDRSLPVPHLLEIETHLSLCVECRQETNLLRETILQVKGLPALELPLGFTQRIMAHVREIEYQPSFAQRLLQALRGSFPLAATSLIAIGILSLYITKEQPTGWISRETPANPMASRADSSRSATESTAARHTEPALNIAAGPEQTPTSQSTADETSTVIKTGVGKPEPEPSRSSAGSSSSQEAAASNESRFGSQPAISGTPVKAPSGPSYSSIGSSSNWPAQDINSNSGMPSAGPAIEPFADFEMVLRWHSATASGRAMNPAEEPPANRTPAQLRDRFRDLFPDRNAPRVVWIDIPKNQFETFKNEMQTVGIIESLTRVPLLSDGGIAAGDGRVRIKVTALPPPADNAPSRPPSQR